MSEPCMCTHVPCVPIHILYMFVPVCCIYRKPSGRDWRFNSVLNIAVNLQTKTGKIHYILYICVCVCYENTLVLTVHVCVCAVPDFSQNVQYFGSQFSSVIRAHCVWVRLLLFHSEKQQDGDWIFGSTLWLLWFNYSSNWIVGQPKQITGLNTDMLSFACVLQLPAHRPQYGQQQAMLLLVCAGRFLYVL